ncbi:hypothetical protein [Paenibacillus protaetiae]|uniref:Uncharacterized protein n=1 Tax=Paenibacillus protaetiae TaxID=2509456 RepID=A0A4P6ERE1_9BACL|nr:hypothetical protein [Paenibacillus protaetiae]QAY65452.1 hypothetical protein ET464_02730 [Paenibacillus protaetiae]
MNLRTVILFNLLYLIIYTTAMLVPDSHTWLRSIIVGAFVSLGWPAAYKFKKIDRSISGTTGFLAMTPLLIITYVIQGL